MPKIQSAEGEVQTHTIPDWLVYSSAWFELQPPTQFQIATVFHGGSSRLPGALVSSLSSVPQVSSKKGMRRPDRCCLLAMARNIYGRDLARRGYPYRRMHPSGCTVLTCVPCTASSREGNIVCKKGRLQFDYFLGGGGPLPLAVGPFLDVEGGWWWFEGAFLDSSRSLQVALRCIWVGCHCGKNPGVNGRAIPCCRVLCLFECGSGQGRGQGQALPSMACAVLRCAQRGDFVLQCPFRDDSQAQRHSRAPPPCGCLMTIVPAAKGASGISQAVGLYCGAVRTTGTWCCAVPCKGHCTPHSLGQAFAKETRWSGPWHAQDPLSGGVAVMAVSGYANP